MTPPPTERSRVFWLQLASLLATGWVVWNGAFVPQLKHHSMASLVWRAVVYSLLAGLWSGLITLGLMLAVRRTERAEVIGITLRTAGAGIWFAPATILMLQGSPLAAGASLILVASATRLLYSQWRLIHPDSRLASVLVPRAAGIFGEGAVPDAFLPRSFGPALAVAMGIQLGIVAWLFNMPNVSAALFTMTTALLTIFSIAAGAWEEQRQPTLPRSIMGILLTVLLAAALTFGGYATASQGGGMADGEENPFAKPAKPDDVTQIANIPHPKSRLVQPAVSKVDTYKKIDPGTFGPSAPGAFPGVIILPEEKPVPFLIEPAVRSATQYQGLARHMIIPFGGEYWLFRYPFSRPPSNSILRKGQPSALSFTSIDRWPLLMEAHQELGQTLDLSCCSRIQVAVSNADLYPHTITVELLAVDSKSFGIPSQSLGRALLQSAPDTKSSPVAPVPETLEFLVPPAPVHGQFDGFTVIFHRERVRGDKSARVSINHFELVPR